MYTHIYILLLSCLCCFIINNCSSFLKYMYLDIYIFISIYTYLHIKLCTKNSFIRGFLQIVCILLQRYVSLCATFSMFSSVSSMLQILVALFKPGEKNAQLKDTSKMRKNVSLVTTCSFLHEAEIDYKGSWTWFSMASHTHWLTQSSIPVLLIKIIPKEWNLVCLVEKKVNYERSLMIAKQVTSKKKSKEII